MLLSEAGAVSEQREVQERGSSGGGELELQQAVDRHVSEPSAGGDRVSPGDKGGREADPGRAHHVQRDVP